MYGAQGSDTQARENNFFPKLMAVRSFLPYTYLPNWLLQPFGRDYDLASHFTHVVCIILAYSLTALKQ